MGSSQGEEEGVEFKDVLRHLDREQAHIVIRLETRRFGKPMTVVQGLDRTGRDLQELTAQLKRRLATGGSAKEGLVLLQGDQRARVRDELVNLGFSPRTLRNSRKHSATT